MQALAATLVHAQPRVGVRKREGTVCGSWQGMRFIPERPEDLQM
jgi:hypothetical protein